MTNEELLEEILYEAHSLGIQDEVVELSKTFDFRDRVDSMQKALYELKIKLRLNT